MQSRICGKTRHVGGHFSLRVQPEIHFGAGNDAEIAQRFSKPALSLAQATTIAAMLDSDLRTR